MDRAESSSDKVIEQLKIKRLLKIFWAVEFVLAIAAIQLVWEGSWQIACVVVIAIIAMSPVFYLAKKNKLTLATNILLLFLTIILLGFVWAFGGLRDEVLFVFPAIIMIAFLLGSQRFALYIYLLVCLNLLAIGYLNEYNYISNDTDSSSIFAGVLLTIILTFVTYIAWLISSEMKQANRALIANRDELEERVKQRTKELEQSIDNLTDTQEQLIQTEKMASLGRLVAGVAHEINTPVGIAITASSHLEETTKNITKLYDSNTITKPLLKAYIDTAMQSAVLLQSNLSRAANLVQGFKEVAVDQSNDEIRAFNLKEYLNEIIASLHPKIKQSRCQIELTCADNINITSSPGALAQVMTNLVVNTITHAFENITDGSISITVEQRETHIFLHFKDNGCGIPVENIAKIFEPFFTTKRGQGGSGLGMHIVYNLVTQSLQGNIRCASTIDEGTSFYINFPSNIESSSL